MIDALFKGSISLAVLVVVAGIVAAPLTGSQKAFEFAPIVSLARKTARWVARSAQDATQIETNPAPFTQEVQTAVGSLRQSPQPVPSPTPDLIDDPRLAICPVGSLEPQALRLLPGTLAEQVRQQWQTNPPQDLTQVQAALGQPVCQIRQGQRRQYRYLVTGGRIIDAVQTGDKLGVQVTFTHFNF